MKSKKKGIIEKFVLALEWFFENCDIFYTHV